MPDLGEQLEEMLESARIIGVESPTEVVPDSEPGCVLEEVLSVM